MAKQAGQVLRMARPAAYWARRAALQHRSGNRRQAGALYQHAVTLTPDNIHLKLAYARVLRELHRYEASNRQAFTALALDPFCTQCIGLIGQNLLSLRYPEEAADAFAHALENPAAGMADAYTEQLEQLETMLDDPADCAVRYRVLVQRAAEYLSTGTWERALRTLDLACAIPRQDERCHALLSLYWKAQGNTPRAIREAVLACGAAPENARARFSLAELYATAGLRAQALRSLLLAAKRVHTADDERLLCQTALTLGFPAAPLPALEKADGHVRTLFNQAVLLLMTGQARLALSTLDRCRTLDPDDVPTRYLRRTAQALTALPPAVAAEHAKGLRLYPALSDADSESCFRDFMQAMDDGPDAFADRLQADDSLHRLLLYQVENPNADVSGILEQGIPYLKENFTLRLMREILLLPSGGLAEKQLAIKLLLYEKTRPFVLWHGGRLSFIKPREGGETADDIRLKRLLVLMGTAPGDPRLTTCALRLIRHMPPRVRAKLAAAESSAFRTAVRMYAAQADAAQNSTPVPHHVRRLYQMLRRNAPANQSGGQPRLWIAGHREEIPWN